MRQLLKARSSLMSKPFKADPAPVKSSQIKKSEDARQDQIRSDQDKLDRVLPEREKVRSVDRDEAEFVGEVPTIDVDQVPDIFF